MSVVGVAAAVGFDERHVRRLWVLVVTLFAIAVACLLVGHVYIYGDGRMSAALAGSLVAHVSSRPTRLESLATLLIAGGFYAFGGPAFDLGGVQPIFDRIVSALGMASVLMQVARLTRMRAADWTSPRGGHAALALLTPMFSLAFASSIALPGLFRHDVYDALMLHFDRAVAGGRAVPFVVGRWLAVHPWVAACATFCYWAPEPLDVLVYLEERRRGTGRDLLTALFIAGFAGYAFYPFFPVVGPGHAFPGFPADPTNVAAALGGLDASIPRNCMPSLHLTDALIVAVHVWRFRSWGWRIVGVVDVALTTIATLGCGYHWAADLVAALPFTYGVLGAARRDWRAAAIGGALTVGFLFVLRYGF